VVSLAAYCDLLQKHLYLGLTEDEEEEAVDLRIIRHDSCQF
jgi:hypothetical protein